MTVVSGAEYLCELPFHRAGYDPDRSVNVEPLSCRQYEAYKLQICPTEKNYILKMGRLFQQYAVDIYVKLGNTNLISAGRVRRRSELGYIDNIEQGLTAAQNVGHHVIIPPLFIGGLRDMKL